MLRKVVWVLWVFSFKSETMFYFPILVVWALKNYYPKFCGWNRVRDCGGVEWNIFVYVGDYGSIVGLYLVKLYNGLVNVDR